GRSRGAERSNGLAPGERMRQRTAIDVLQLTADGHAVRDPAGTQSAASGELREEMRRGLSLDGRIGREDQLADRALLEKGLELANAELLRADAVERRQVTHQHEVTPAVTARLLDGDHIGRRLHDAQKRGLPLRRGADRAQLLLGEHAATAAAHHRSQRAVERLRERARRGARVLQEMKGHALSRLRPDTRERTQGFDELGEAGRVLQNGSFIPGGSCRPAVIDDIFSCTFASTLWTASFTAAAMRSSSISRSSPITAGSICTRRVSCRPLMVTFTIPPPDSPTTSSAAISSWTFCMLACMACACFIRLLKLPFIWLSSFYGSNSLGDGRRAETLAKPLHTWVGLEGAARSIGLFLGGTLVGLRRGLSLWRDCRELQPNGLAVVLRQRLGQLLLHCRRPHDLAARVERQPHDCAFAADEHAMRRKLASEACQLERGNDGSPIFSAARCAGRGGARRPGSASRLRAPNLRPCQLSPYRLRASRSSRASRLSQRAPGEGS